MVSYQRSENGRYFKRFRENSSPNHWTNHNILEETEDYLILNKGMNVPGTFLTIIEKKGNKFMEVYILLEKGGMRTSGKCILGK